MSNDTNIRDTLDSDIPHLNAAINSVIAERLYLAPVIPISLESSEQFVSKCLRSGYPNVVAETGARIVGWCDITANEPAEYAHVGCLGMGIIPGFRGRGLGRLLITAAIERARLFGFEKIELNVYHDNHKARSLYKQVGFAEEGTSKHYRKIDGFYQDNIFMALFLTESDRSNIT